MHWILIVALILVANVLLAIGVEGAKRALQDWGASYSTRRARAASSS
jgi:hypothetical protein